MSPGRLHTDVLDLARAVLQGQHAVPARQAARMAALLARQAREDVIESLCGPELTRATMRTRLVYVRVLVNAEIADRAGVAWHGLRVPNKVDLGLPSRVDVDLRCGVVGRGEQPPWIVSDGLWQRIEPLLPQPVPRNPRYPGRKRIPDRQVLCGILFVLHTGIQWEFLPQELGFGSGMTCWRRLEEWNRAGVWQRLHELLLAELHGAGHLDLSRAVIDSSQCGLLGAA